jgi:hypothetical protein
VGIQDQIHLAIKLEIKAQVERPLNFGEALTRLRRLAKGQDGSFTASRLQKKFVSPPIPKS